MKTQSTSIFIVAILAAVVVIAHWYKGLHSTFVQPPSQLKLEKVISVKELHLVKHHYDHQFYLYRKNDPSKSVRPIGNIPVTVTAYIDLKVVKVIRSKDSIRQVILPHAKLLDPHFHLNELQVQKTRAFSLYAGKDLYPQVANYLKETISSRSDTIREHAIRNHILQQAETEAREYVEELLRATGHPHVEVVYAKT